MNMTHPKPLNQHTTDKILRQLASQLAVETQYQQRIQTASFHPARLAPHPGDAIEGLIRLKKAPGMGLKGHGQGRNVQSTGSFAQGTEHRLMAPVDAIKIADGHRCTAQ